MELDEIKAEAAALGPWAFLATVGADGEPDVVPVHPAWEGDVLWIVCERRSVKCRNIAHQPAVALHWQVGDSGNGVEVWGRASLHDDLATKHRLWDGVFSYDLATYASGGPDDSPEIVFMAVEPRRALFMRAFGVGGQDTWRA